MSRPPLWKPFILAASYVFYGAADPRFCILLAGVTLANQAAAVLIDRAPDARSKKGIMAAAVAVDLGVLAVFKYYGFFVDELNGLFDSFGLGLPVPIANIALPIGVSFYTFQAISYAVDVYRGIIKPAPTIDLAIYLSFFPHVVAGPIVRAREILPQLARPRDPNDVRVGAAVVLIGGRPGQEGGHRRLPRAGGGGPRLRRARGVRGARTSHWPPMRSPPRSTATSPATPTSRSGSPC